MDYINTTPRYKHECVRNSCIFLGRYFLCDLYYCSLCSSLIARHGIGSWDYRAAKIQNSSNDNFLPIRIAEQRAVKLGWI